MSTNTGRYTRRANTALCLPLHELLHDTVLKRVIADDDQPATVSEKVNRLL
jgi:hypothetical protein